MGRYYSPPQRLEGNESPVFVDVSGCGAAVMHRNFIAKSSISIRSLCGGE